MAGPTKPSLYLNWTNGSSPAVTQPPSSLQTSGWLPTEAPPPDFMNWLFWLTDSWIQYLDFQVEQVINAASGITALSTILSTTGNTSTVTNTNQVTSLASTTGIVIGMLVTGSPIPAGTYVRSISGATVTLTKNVTATLSGTAIAFSHVYATGANVQVQLDALDAIESYQNNVLTCPVALNPATQSPYVMGTVDNGSVFWVNSDNGSQTFNLPAPSPGYTFRVKDVGTKGFLYILPIIFHRFSTELFETLAADYSATAPGGEWVISTDGTNWYIIGR
jgi:hypothetical protein